ncbi:hypothetical protein [Pseudonocardia broussonetiae]|uniref:Uncharacterized protein n=1 Tax=Pseudonocardia broussonetiae TaxID=2736640 RepID=A0A6M6JN75_9PSEU|nr:hypothetical protein [Pseudonocardia broussonetiae]QJY47889.1 hypothetical protein HOP40_20515 [Pseudonocardia broussonetiae]
MSQTGDYRPVTVSGARQVVRQRAAMVLLFAVLMLAQSTGLCIALPSSAAPPDVAASAHCEDHHADEHMTGASTWRGPSGVPDRCEPVDVPDVTHVMAAPEQRRARRAGGRRCAPTGRRLLDRLCIART